MIRSRHLMAGAALALALIGSADARQYKNSGAPTESLGVVPEVNDQAVSTANPLPVSVVGGGGGSGSTGSVTAPGTNGTQAQAVQGITGGVPVGVSATTLPLPAGASTEATQQGVAISNSAINTATGSQSDAATASGANTSIIGALRAIRDRLLGGIQINGFDGSVNRIVRTTTTGVLEPPTAAAGKATPWFASLSATTSTQLLAANAARLAYSLQCSGTAPVAVSETGATLTTATPASGSNITLIVPSGATPYFTPAVASLTAITGYTGTAQTCWGVEYLR